MYHALVTKKARPEEWLNAHGITLEYRFHCALFTKGDALFSPVLERAPVDQSALFNALRERLEPHYVVAFQDEKEVNVFAFWASMQKPYSDEDIQAFRETFGISLLEVLADTWLKQQEQFIMLFLTFGAEATQDFFVTRFY